TSSRVSPPTRARSTSSAAPACPATSPSSTWPRAGARSCCAWRRRRCAGWPGPASSSSDPATPTSTASRRRPRRSTWSPGFASEQLLQLGLADDLDAVLLGGLHLGPADVGAGDEVAGLLGDAAGHLAAGLLDAANDLLAWPRQRAGDHEGPLEFAPHRL